MGGGSTTWRRGRARSADCVAPVDGVRLRVTLFAQGRVATCLGYAVCAGAAAGRAGGGGGPAPQPSLCPAGCRRIPRPG